FALEKAKILSIAGASGSGKTTLLHLLIGYLQISKGSVTIDGKSAQQQKHSIGFSAQQPSIYPKLTVWENLDLFGTLYGLTKSTITKNAKVLLHLIDLYPYKDFLAEQLSGGMLKRL